MSSITFSSQHTSGFGSSASSISDRELHDYSSSFDVVPDVSFQTNPLSAHPPRSSHHATGSTSSVYGREVYSNAEEVVEKTLPYDADSDYGDDKARAEAESKVRKEEVWRELLKTTNGRDKALKAMQYSLRMYLLFHSSFMMTSLLRSKTRRPWDIELVKRCESTIGGLSLTRKCLILFNWLTPLTSILAQHDSVPYSIDSSGAKSKSKPLLHTFLHTQPPVLLELVNGLSDDVYTFARLGLIGKRLGERAGRFSDWCWFVGTLIDLVENTLQRNVVSGQQHEVESRLYTDSMTGATTKSNPKASKIDEQELARLHREAYWIRVSFLKLVMDLIFVSYNVFNMKRAKNQVQTFTGLAAALLSTSKLYERHKMALFKAP
ncbi:uncharacterized protein LAESUDRAFT_640427 [Laetiporus sulphureus 93-53]|uniref:Peroxisomal biogenesis factor 11 n=1 Tax=Laetiporus sulphureus 93-53 TaxID=1314785 RepID=A0A165IEN8_9APHY|nr:uncharacterized protein LAESUDRAFT_640427 [Laetiporus sulphureus 93-53]KZT12971.1 hypothetical protein LAESUDRAFT_640427 [Laetiporus sulphureus 93-53]